jgi:hypothetical protein
VGREFEWGSVLKEDGEVIDAMRAIETSSLADVRMDEVFEGGLPLKRGLGLGNVWSTVANVSKS